MINRNVPDADKGSSADESARALAEDVGAKEIRKLRKRHDRDDGVWFGLGMMGLIGWSVVVPTLLGAALGMWLDARYPGQHSWTLALLVLGLAAGCFNAWHWVSREDQAMRDEQDDDEPGQDDV